MKFKVWDKVRVTREGLTKQADQSFVKSYEVSWWTIKKIAGDKIYCPNNEYWYEEKFLELIPEEPEFKEGELIETRDEQNPRLRRTYLTTIKWKDKNFYLCVSEASLERYKLWLSYNVCAWPYARKLKSQLTRKEIAEKFWVSEDFTLID